jgi:phospho-N-acetylmuramoyl-pentapeptide-transferase
VNLTDGLDGLAGGTGAAAFAVFAVVAIISSQFSMAVFAISITAGLLAFLLRNTRPASIIMGDTGALSLGGALATTGIFLNNPLIIIIIGIVFIFTTISVIAQVLYFKATKGKRIFLMSPFHHHLELKGMPETKIAALYTVTTLIAGIIAIISYII